MFPKDSLPSTIISKYAQVWWENTALNKDVNSPFGAWLLVALLAEHDQTGEISRVLGVDAKEAKRLAEQFILNPHPALKSATALWGRLGLLNDLGSKFFLGNNPALPAGTMPTQEEADKWTAEKTSGMITEFPIKIKDDLALVLASALMTDIAWIEPYQVVPAGELVSTFANKTESCLKGENVAFYNTKAAGLVAMHSAQSDNGLQVFSFMASKDVSPAALNQAAAEILHLEGSKAEVVEIGALLLGEFLDGSASLVELDGFRDYEIVYLPAWKQEVDKGDISKAPGVSEALGVMSTFLKEPDGGVAKQSAVAEYGALGFRAAAVTAFGMLGLAIPQKRLVREVTVRFNRPYLAIAVTSSMAPDTQKGRGEVQVADKIWDGIPVFSAWVTHPVEATVGKEYE